MVKIDATNAKILRELLKDGRKDFSAIAKDIGISKNSVSRRYKEMREAGIIIGATTQLNYSQLGLSAVEVHFTIDSSNRKKVEDALPKLPESWGEAFNDVGPRDGKSVFCLFSFVRDLREIEEVKTFIGERVYSAEAKTYIWTGAKNMPYNLTFGVIEENSGEPPMEEAIAKAGLIEKPIIDETDLKIIDKLSENGCLSFSEIAHSIGVAVDTVAKRYNKLKQNRSLNIVAQINPEKLGYFGNVEAMIQLVSGKDMSLAIQAFSAIPNLYHISKLTGDRDLHIWALVRDLDDYLQMKDRITQVPGISKIDIELNRLFRHEYPTPRQYVTTI